MLVSKLFLALFCSVADGASLGGTAWHDLDGDGLREAGEAPLARVVVALFSSTDLAIGNGDDACVGRATTGVDGAYTFRELAPATYYLVLEIPMGWDISPARQGFLDSEDSNFVGSPPHSPLYSVSDSDALNSINAGLRWDGTEHFETGAVGWTAEGMVWETWTTVDGEAQFIPLTPDPSAEIVFELGASQYDAQEPIQALWSASPADTHDWIAIYSDLGDQGRRWIDWRYTSGTRTPGSGLVEGSVTFPGLNPGRYLAIFYSDNTYSPLAPPVSFDVLGISLPEFDLSTSRAHKGEPLTVSWTGCPGNIRDWIGIYRPKAFPGTDSPVVWLYTNVTGTASEPQVAGSVMFPTQQFSPGEYLVYFFADNGYSLLAGPKLLVIDPPDPLDPPVFNGIGLVGTSLGQNYPTAADSRLISPGFDLAPLQGDERAEVRFWQSYHYGADDRAKVEYAVWNGFLWGPWGELVTVAETNFFVTEASAPGWHPRRLDVSHLAGKRIRIALSHFSKDSLSVSGIDTAPGWHVDDFELWRGLPATGQPDGWAGWTVEGGVWQIGELPAAMSESPRGRDAAVAGTILDGDYPAYSDSRLVGPVLDLPALVGEENLVLTFQSWYNYNTGDQGLVEISEWDGLNWGPWLRLWATPDPAEIPPTWSELTLSLSPHAGKRVRLGFSHLAGEGPSGDPTVAAGWFVDEVRVLQSGVAPSTNLPEGFEAGWNGWLVDNGGWQLRSANPGSDPSIAFEGTSFASFRDDGLGVNSRLLSPPVLLPSLGTGESLELRFAQWVNQAVIAQGQVQVAVWNGAYWGAWSPIEPLEGWGWLGDWSPVRLAISDYAGRQVRFGFLAGIAAQWHVDQIELWKGPAPAPLPPSPNPFGVGITRFTNQADHAVSEDLNGDGRRDLVIADRFADQVLVALAGQDGAFTSTRYELTSPRRVYLFDLTGDGRNDLIAHSYGFGSSAVSVLPATGDGFGPPVAMILDGEINQLAFGDLDADGVVDMAGIDGSDRVRLWAGNGRGAFGLPIDLVVPRAQLAQIFLSDSNLDGLPEIIARDTTDGFWWIPNSGGRTFGAPRHTATSSPISGLAIGLLNADSHLDVVAAVGKDVLAYYGTASAGTFGAPVLLQRRTENVGYHLKIADLNLDRRGDVVVVDRPWTLNQAFAFETISVLLAEEDGGFTPTPFYRAATEVSSVEVADFSGDGIPDLAVTDQKLGQLHVLAGTGDGTFLGATSLFDPGVWVTDLLVDDLDRDGFDDLISSIESAWPGDRLLLLYFNAAGEIDARAIALDSGQQYLAAADFDRDGDQDLAIASWSQFEVFTQLDAGRTWSPSRFYFLEGENPSYSEIEATDLNQDGAPDLLVLDQNNDRLLLVPNLGDGTFDLPSVTTIEGFDTRLASIDRSLQLFDVDADGLLDVVNLGSTLPVLTTNPAGILKVWKTLGDGTLTPLLTIERNNEIVYAGDLDLDGTLDWVEVNTQGWGRAYLSQADRSYAPGAEFFTGSDDLVFHDLRDLNQDGHLDLVATTIRDEGSLALFWGCGDGNFSDLVLHFVGPGIERARAGDTNGDGRAEIYTARGLAVLRPAPPRPPIAELEIISIELAPDLAAMTVRWTAEPGRSYQLQFSNDLSPGSWLPSSEVVVADASIESLAVTLDPAKPKLFVRVVLLLPSP